MIYIICKEDEDMNCFFLFPIFILFECCIFIPIYISYSHRTNQTCHSHNTTVESSTTTINKSASATIDNESTVKFYTATESPNLQQPMPLPNPSLLLPKNTPKPLPI